MRTLIATLHDEFHVHLGDRDEHWKSIVMVTSQVLGENAEQLLARGGDLMDYYV